MKIRNLLDSMRKFNYIFVTNKKIYIEVLELMSSEELSAIKGGFWAYDEETDEWYFRIDGECLCCQE